VAHGAYNCIVLKALTQNIYFEEWVAYTCSSHPGKTYAVNDVKRASRFAARLATGSDNARPPHTRGANRGDIATPDAATVKSF